MLPIVFHPAYEVDIGTHVFPTRKYRLVSERLREEHTIARDNIKQPTAVSDDDVALVHTAEYIEKLRRGSFSAQEELLLEVPFSSELRDAMWLCAGGTLLTAALALERAVAVHLGGGFHHAFPDHGEGFCLVNDVAVAIGVLRRDNLVDRVLVIDLDVHHGNGTAAIFADEEAVFTFSMHQEQNYPAVKPPGDLDIGLEDGTDDVTYLRKLETHLPDIISDHRPDIAFYLAGADPYIQDQLGGLNLSIEGLKKRDELVFDYLRGAVVPVAVTLAGGYALNHDDTVEIHCNTVRAARKVYLRPTERVKTIRPA